VFTNRVTLYGKNQFIRFGSLNPYSLRGLNSFANPADGWPISIRGTLLGYSLPTDSLTGINQVGWTLFDESLRRDDWNHFAISTTRIPTDPVTINGVARGCAETLKIEWWGFGSKQCRCACGAFFF
jgi:hypothetical protein